MTRAQADDPQAWQRLVDLYGPLVYRWSRQSGLRSEDAADVLQEVFTAVAGGLKGYRGGRRPGSFRAWLKTITRNKVRDLFRCRQDEAVARGGTTAQGQMLQLADPCGPDEESLSKSEDDAVWLRGLQLVQADFEPRTWQAFWLVSVEGRSVKDVAGQLEMSPGAVHVAKHRVLRRLRHQLSDLEPAD